MRAAASASDEARDGLAVTLQSFSYKRGVPRGIDMVIDVRFLRNPHWDRGLRPHDGRDPAVRAFVEADPAYAALLRAAGRSADLPAAGLSGGR